MNGIPPPESDADNVSLVLVMGITGAGKSYFINKATGTNLAEVGHSLTSCTDRATAIPATIGREKVLLIDTPGFDDTHRSDADILTEISKLLAFQYEAGMKLKGVIFLHRITDPRMQGMSLKTLNICNKICGKDALKNVILVTTRWNEVNSITGAQRETELREKFWRFMLDFGSTMMRYYGDEASAVAIASQLISKSTIVLDLQRELVDQGKKLSETQAGAVINQDIETIKADYSKRISDLQQLNNDLMASGQNMGQAFRKDMEAEQEKLQSVQQSQAQLQRPVGVEVREEIKQKSKTRRVLGTAFTFLPVTISLLAAFVGFPTGGSDIFASWFGDW